MFQDPTAVSVSGGSGIKGWQVTGEGGSSGGGGGEGGGTATALLVSGPFTGEVLVASAPYIVSANGTLTGSVTITPSATGGAGTWAPTSQTITNGQQASFVFTPNAVAVYTIGFSNNGGLDNPASRTYDSVSPAPPPVDIENNWLVDISPTRPWNANQGNIPAGCLLPTNKAGNDNKNRMQYEKCGDSGPSSVDPETEATTASTINANGGTWMARVADPVNGARTCYKLTVNRTVANWTTIDERFRSEMMATGTDRFEPWDGEQWTIGAIYLPDYWHDVSTGGADYAIMMQWHDASGGLTGNPPVTVSWKAGNGNPANSRFGYLVRVYDNPNWPTNQANKLNKTVANGEFQGLTEDWVYLIWKYRTGNGYVDPVHGQIYGPVGANRKAYVRLYVALGEAAVPQLLMDCQKFWGGPFPSSMDLATKQGQSGYWKTGLYSKTNFNDGAGNNREVFFKGFTTWRSTDIPSNVSAAQMLAAFKALRD